MTTPSVPPRRLSFLCFLARALPARLELPGPPGARVTLIGADQPRYAELVERLTTPQMIVEARQAGVHACPTFVRARAVAHVEWDLPQAAGTDSLRLAWRLVAQLCARGQGLAVLDGVALRWHAARDLPALGSAPTESGSPVTLVGRELKLEPWSEREPLVDPAARPACIRTRGLSKFDQPELLLVDPLSALGNLETARSFLLGLADHLLASAGPTAPGRVVRLPGWRVELLAPWDLPAGLALRHKDALRVQLTPAASTRPRRAGVPRAGAASARLVTLRR